MQVLQGRNCAIHWVQRAAFFTVLLLILPFATACGSIGLFIGDAMPQWAGGLPAEAPPRPSDPRYEEYVRPLKTSADALSKSLDQTTEGNELPSGTRR